MECKQSKAKPFQFERDDRAWTCCCLNSSSGIPPGEALPSLLGTGMKQSLSGCSLNPTIKECKLFYISDMKVFPSWRIEPWHRRWMGILWASCKALKKFFIQQEFVLNSDGPPWKYQIKWNFQWATKTWASRSAFNWWPWGHKTTQKEQTVSSLAVLKGLFWGGRGMWPSVTAWLALGTWTAFTCCSEFGSFIKRQKGCLNLWHFPLCADIFLSVPSFRVTLYAEFLPMKARAKCILLIEVSGCILILWWSHPFHPPAWKSPQSCTSPPWCGAESLLSSGTSPAPKAAENFPVTLPSWCWIFLFPNYFAPRTAEWAQEGHWVSMIL